MGVIELNNISKRYRLHSRQLLAQRLKSFARERREFWALRDISFRIDPGESVAIVGHNGAGKSTVLGIIAGVTAPTAGTVRTQGRIGALLELGAGFHPDLTGRENIQLNGALLGLSESEIRAKFDEIVAFSELERFLEEPLRTYSSGMQARLGFSIAVHIEPQTVILDEVLSVGDQAFQKKSAAKVEEMARSGVTLLVVSHSLDLARRSCRRAIWLDQGRVKEDGPIDGVFEHYRGNGSGKSQP